MKVGLTDASGIVRDALGATARRLGKSEDQIASAMRSGACSVCDALRHSLAQAMGQYLGTTDLSVRAVFSYEPEHATAADVGVSERPNLSPGINLIVWVDRRSAALSAVIASLRDALAEQVESIACSRANALCWMLDAQIVDDEQVEMRTGYGALVNSTFVRPLEVWHR